jgi:Icc protein
MLIAQITDIHLGFERDNPGEMNRLRLDQAVAMLCAMDPRPDFLLCTGDLTDRGDQPSYERLREALQPLPFPHYLVVGNHDLRGPLLNVFPETKTADGFVQYVLDDGPLRLIVIDTMEERRHAGAFGPERARWLQARLAEKPDKPTLIVMHHPPVITGIDWMTLGPEETWAPRLTAIVARHKQVVGAICGHMHRPIVAPWAGTTLRACPSCAPQVVLDLKPMDLSHPDDRPLIQEEPPAYALHMWTPQGLITHYGRVESPETLLRFDSGFQPVLQHFEEERGQEPKYPHLGGGGAAPASALSSTLFGFDGRIGRGKFWLASLATSLVGVVLAILAGMAAPGLQATAFTVPLGSGIAVSWAMVLAALIVAWPFLAIAAKRGHDRGRSAWWLLLLAIPLIGKLWWLIDLGLLEGAPGSNDYGAPPTA